MDRVRCGVVGLGWMGTLHAEYLSTTPQAELVARCDPVLGGAEGPDGTTVFASLEDALARHQIEAVVVATPPHTHRAIVTLALERGLTVLCEKPLAGTLADATAMIEIAARSEGRLLVGHTRRFDPRFTAVAEAVADGRIGRPLHLRGSVNCPHEDAVRLAATTDLALECGVHDLDAMRWLAGDIERVQAEGVDALETPGVDAFTATVRFASGAVGSLCHSWAMPTEVPVDWEFSFQVGGDNGVAEIDGRSRGVTVLSERPGPIHPETVMWPRVAGFIGGALASQDRYFLECVRGDHPWPVTLEDARAAVAAALAISQSIASGGNPVSLSDPT